MKVSPIEDNPLRVLGVFANSTLREIERNKAQLRAFAHSGQPIQLPLWLNGMELFSPLPEVTEDSLSLACSQIAIQADREYYDRFWFEMDSEHAIEDIEAIGCLNKNNIQQVCTIWQKRSDSASQKNLLILAVLMDNWEEIAERSVNFFSGDIAGFRTFMDVVVTSSAVANSANSCSLLGFFVQDNWKLVMERVLVNNHKRMLDKSLDYLKQTYNAKSKLLLEEVAKQADAICHVEGLRELLGADSYVFRYYGNEMAKGIMKIIVKTNYYDNELVRDIIRKVWSLLSPNDPEYYLMCDIKVLCESKVSIIHPYVFPDTIKGGYPNGCLREIGLFFLFCLIVFVTGILTPNTPKSNHSLYNKSQYKNYYFKYDPSKHYKEYNPYKLPASISTGRIDSMIKIVKPLPDDPAERKKHIDSIWSEYERLKKKNNEQ